MWTALVTAWLILGVDASDRHHRVVPLPPGKTVAVDITIGSVRIDGWDKADVEVSVERHAPSAAEFVRLPITIEDSAERLVVRAVQADGNTDPAYRADLVLRVPRAAAVDRVQVLEGRVTLQGFSGSLAADVRRGPIEGRDVSGTLRLETGIGSVVLNEARLSAGGLLRLRAFNGNVRLTLAERPADARILALALNGGITSDIPLAMKNTWGPRWGEATLGKGEPVISLDVVTGVIEIRSR